MAKIDAADRHLDILHAFATWWFEIAFDLTVGSAFALVNDDTAGP